MMWIFRKKKAFLVKWDEMRYTPSVYHETVVISKDGSYAMSKFLFAHDAIREDIEIRSIEEIELISNDIRFGWKRS